DPSTGRAVLGGRVSADPSGPLARPVAETPKSDTPTADSGKATKKATTPSAPPATPSTNESSTRTPQSAVENWSVAVLDELKGMHKAILKMADPVVRDGGVVLQIDNEPSAARVRKYMDEFTSVIHRAAGGACPVTIEVLRPSAPEKVSTIVDDGDSGPDVDIDEIKSLPTVTNTTITDQLTELFPGSELVSEDD
ncbi:MAG: hypothetical protein ACKOA6_09330, partial [Actinomycetota bacterium]